MPCIGFWHLRRVQRPTNASSLHTVGANAPLAPARHCALAMSQCLVIPPLSPPASHKPIQLPSARKTSCQMPGVAYMPDSQHACLLAGRPCAAACLLVWLIDSMGVSSFSCVAVWLGCALFLPGNGRVCSSVGCRGVDRSWLTLGLLGCACHRTAHNELISFVIMRVNHTM